MKFHHNTLPESSVIVLAAWSNGEDFHVLQSAWDDDKKEWSDSEGFGTNNNLTVYAWTEWPEAPAPKVRQDKMRMFISRLLKRVNGPQWRTCYVCGIFEWALGWPDGDFYVCSNGCIDRSLDISF